MAEFKPVVIDNGSNTIKVGFGGDETPQNLIPTRIGRPIRHGTEVAGIDSNCYVGKQAISRRRVLTIKYPISCGYVNNWDDMEDIWEYAFATLGIDPTLHPVLHTELPWNPSANREKLTQIMFETFNVPRASLQSTAMLSFLSTGRVTGVLLDCGYEQTRAVPIYDGATLPHAMTRSDIGGEYINDYLISKLQEKGNTFHSISDRPVLDNIKHNMCYVSLDTKQQRVSECSFMLPDGNVLTLGEERFMCPEILFDPSLDNGRDTIGIQHVLCGAIKKCDLGLFREMYGNIVLAGGASLFRGVEDRLKQEVKAIGTTYWTTNITAPAERQYSAWLGGSMLSSLEVFDQLCVNSDDYEEHGPALVHRRGIY